MAAKVQTQPSSTVNTRAPSVPHMTSGAEVTIVKAARERGVDRLLRNPQNLDMLAKAVSGGKWPDSRKETFDQACRILARESNGDHLAADPSRADTGPLIEAAGRLCAAQLLSGAAGYTLPDRAEPDGDYPSFTEVDGEAGGGTTRNVLGTRLFVGTSEGRLAPAHRQIAEFLAARHVSGLLDKGLSLERILALITGFDGELLPTFTNFASWLAVHNKRSRKRLSELNPSSLIYHGDTQTYSTDEKRAIVRNLRRESYWNPSCSREVSKVPGIGAIVSPELEGTFREILTGTERTGEHQSYVMLLMLMLADGKPLPALSDVLEHTVRDQTWYQGVRCAALDALIRYHSRGRFDVARLKRMVAEIEDGSLDDPRDELLGILLKALYPKILSVAEVQGHLREPKFAEAHEYLDFWTQHVSKESTAEQLAELLDGIAARFEDYKPALVGEPGQYNRLRQLPMELLTRVLREARWCSMNVGADRLYEWLGVVSDPGLEVPAWQESSVQFDLQWSTDALKALIAHGVETCLHRGEKCTGLVDRRLFGARPWGYGPWCLEMALAAEESEAASFYLRELVDYGMDGARADGLTVEGARAGLAAHEALMNQFDEMVERRTRGATRTESRTAPESSMDVESRGDTDEQRSWQADIAAQAPVLRAGLGAPLLLRRAAEAYLGIHEDSTGKTPRQRLGDLIGRRVELIDLLLAGMEGTIVREDLPGCDDVVRRFDRNRVDSLVLPYVAGLHSLEQSGRLSASVLSESHIRLAVTILYMLPQKFLDPDSASTTDTYRPAWFRTLLRDNPALVADVLRRSTALKLETGLQPAIELRELAAAEDHREVAALASLPVLESFPKAETTGTLMALCRSLTAALTSCDWSEVGRVIEERLGSTRLAAEEHSCWLTAGFLVAPERYRENFQALAADEQGVKWLSRLVAVRFRVEEFTRRLAARDVEAFVVAMGAAFRLQYLTQETYWSTADVIATLHRDPSVAATAALEALSRVPDAEPWWPVIRQITESQARKRREHEYRHGEFGQVVKTLDNQSPANAGDLAALVFDELMDVSARSATEARRTGASIGT